MKSKLIMKASALVWAIVMIAACTVAAQAQSNASRNPHPASKETTIQLTGINPAVTGTGTTGQLTKWTSLNGIGDSIISEDKFGRVGISTTSPTSKLTVGGTIETTAGGVKFPDGSVQATAATGGLAAVAHDATLKGNGTSLSPLSVVSNDPALTAVQYVLQGDGSSITVPDGKRLVIDFVSGIGVIPSGQKYLLISVSTFVANVTLSNYFIPNLVGSDGGFDNYFISQPARLYADSGNSVQLRVLSALGTGSMTITLQGHLVNLQ